MIHKNELNDMNNQAGWMDLILKEGMVWKDLAELIRVYITTSAGDQEALRQRLSQIPTEFGDIFRLFFGDEISNAYTNLFSDYITSLEALIDAQKNDDDNAVNSYMGQIHDNIHLQSDFLSKINPFWQESEWRALFFKYLLMTIDEANAFISGDQAKSTEIYNKLLSQAAIMFDYFSKGLYQYITARLAS
jgi:hypothetical protein